ncbi:cytochrome c oxidase accessory protein CcoG [Polymorphobacter fuscus]|uniref:Cytochrome c oxidase accessory protein CcoG n=1 Tax=Sandarakinorhabdus fusca TaxID=1439888 RepID=A0A7C9GNU5_9SPHN|nr:cytochrome c oxidase accessory protein CcoG [Polymorphobacter fuscus]KAB7648671.1 cytochrome c oxidase accessory protein CcoG [Polymorphobacter fuscus]MQT16230.1 cytochrome c oxidase accessory protein CcoG [Polymorphobacter fuscus]NJC07485.1 cytochrome c oxidase accessory protein FixG [Polymorphobacter fuscus]
MAALDLISPNSPLYSKRKGVYPKAVNGFYRRLKWLVMAVTLTIYYVTPWLRWDRGPYAPDQAVLIDLAHRRFYMFSIEIWPQEFYYVAGLLVMAGIGLFLVTSAVGRAWCGYACPQTVWTDLFVHVERLTDGDRNAQIRLARAPMTPGKAAKRFTKHAIWIAIAVATGGAWIFYFADAPTLAVAFVTGSAPFVAYATVGVLTATTYILGGLMREQVCIYMCPWPRIQTAMLDEKSLIVTYKYWRGEPRTRGLKKPVPQLADFPTESINIAMRAGRAGDCIDCDSCVAVCPTGIDIREGPQIGCITCALCIDACDKVMAQIGRPRGLIDYATLEDAVVEKAGGAPRPVLGTLLRPRTLVYFAIWAGIGGAMLFSLGERSRLDISVASDRNPRYVQLSDGSIRNSYTVKLRNMEARPRGVDVSVSGLPGAVMWTEAGSRDTAGPSTRVTLAPDATTQLRLFVAAPADGSEHSRFHLQAQPIDGVPGSKEARPARDDVTFERPEREDAQ